MILGIVSCVLVMVAAFLFFEIRNLILKIEKRFIGRQEALRADIVEELNEIKLKLKTAENEIGILYANQSAARGDIALLQSDREGLKMQVNRLAADTALLERRVVAGKTRLGD